MYLQNVQIKNFRGIEEIDLEFKPGVNILLGDNGTGKTTVLEALTVALGGYLTGTQNLTVGGILQDDFRREVKKISGASRQIIYYAPEISFDLNVEGKSLHGLRTRSNRAGGTKTITKCPEIQKYARDIANDEHSNLPLLSYMSISRVTVSKRADYGKTTKNQLDDRRCGYLGCMDSVIDKTSILEWVKKMSYEEKLGDRQVPELALFQSIVSQIMQIVSEMKEQPTVAYSAVMDDITYSENETMKPVSILSSGYQSLLWMAMDFAFRLALLNPNMQCPEEAHGIILIDEVDMHLHPKWQWNIMNAFRRTFPNMQFIVATHAPIIISSCKDANLIQMNDVGKTTYMRSAYAYSVNHVLELRQNSQGIMPQLQSEISCFDRLLNEGNIEGAKEILIKMEETFGRENSEVVKARTDYELETLMTEE